MTMQICDPLSVPVFFHSLLGPGSFLPFFICSHALLFSKPQTFFKWNRCFGNSDSIEVGFVKILPSLSKSHGVLICKWLIKKPNNRKSYCFHVFSQAVVPKVHRLQAELCNRYLWPLLFRDLDRKIT